MSMSKKNYVEIANIINSYIDKSEIGVSINVLINDLCNYFRADNPNFNGERFFEACKK